MREFKIGDKVLSKVYGEGEVLNINYTLKELTHPILVRFPNYNRGLETTFTKDGMYEDKVQENYDIKHINHETVMKYTTQAEVFEQLARVSKLIEGTDLTLLDVFRFGGEKPHFEYANRDKMLSNPEEYSFALALVEDKPVFAGDKIWSEFSEQEVTVTGLTVNHNGTYLTHYNKDKEDSDTRLDCLAWKQPKKTFTINGVELPLPTDDNSNVHIEITYNYDNGMTNTYYPVPREILKYRWSNIEDRDKVMKAITDLLDGVAND